MKTIILIKGFSNSGKSKVIKTVFEILNFHKTFKIYLLDSTDVKAEGIYNNKLFGIESQGDPNSRQGQSLIEFAKNNCEVIICASRTKGETYENVIELSKIFDYQLIITSTFYDNNKKIGIANNNLDLNIEFSNSIVNLINRL